MLNNKEQENSCSFLLAGDAANRQNNQADFGLEGFDAQNGKNPTSAQNMGEGGLKQARDVNSSPIVQDGSAETFGQIVDAEIGNGTDQQASEYQAPSEANTKDDADVERTSSQKGRGKRRAQKFSSRWKETSLSEAIRKFAPDAKPIVTGSGKIAYTNTQTHISVVYDPDGNYFRIEDTSRPRGRNYLDIDGNDMNNVIIDGKQRGRSQPEYQQVTHFKNRDNQEE